MAEDPPSKRAREGEKDEEKEVDDCKIAAAHKILSFNTDEIASTGLNDKVMFEKLQDFSTHLQTSLDAVKKVRDDKEKVIQEKKKKQAREEQQKKMKQEREEMTKLRTQLIAEKRCFKCNVVHEGTMNECTEYKSSGGGASGDGILVCDKCHDEVTTNSCSSCNGFFHDDIEHKNSSCSCTDDSYVCKSCEEVFCLPCAEGKYMGRNCGGCDDWYCDGCGDDCIEMKCCTMCSKGDECCGNCTADIGECENCNVPLCDGCVRRLACGNDVRLCGECDYCCDDCDMCEGYYGVSRWA